MFSSPGTPRRPQTATERLNTVRSTLNALRDTVDAAETFSLGHLAAASSRGVVRSNPSSPSPNVEVTKSAAQRKAPTPPPPPPVAATPAWRSDMAASPVPQKSSATTAAPTGATPTSTSGAKKLPQTQLVLVPGSPAGPYTPSGASSAVVSFQPRPAAAPSSLTVANVQAFEDAIITMKQHAIKIEEHLAVEATTRMNSDKKLKQLCEQRIREAVTALEKKSSERLAEMHVQVDTLTKKVDKLQSELATERDKNARLTQELKYQATQGFMEVKDHVTQIRNLSQSSQSVLAKNLTENTYRLQERLDVERHARESMLRGVAEEIAQNGRQREKLDERVIQKLRDELHALEVQLRLEKETREKTEEQLALAMEEVVQQIQLGLRNIATGSRS